MKYNYSGGIYFMNRFSFLEQDYPELYLVCSDAMQYGLQDFSIAMLKSRQALEKIVEHFDAEGENLFSKINALGDDGEIPKSVMKHFHTVRKIANPSVHGQEVSEQEILEALDALFEIAVWFAVQKEGHRYEPELFNDRDRFLVRRYENQTGDEDVTNNGKSSGPSQKIDFGKILDEYRKAAEAGDAEAMRTVGEIYAMGKGVVQDYGEAIEWYQKAANVGNTSAMIAMGKLYAEGKGVEQNFGEAMKWYEKAADAGNIDAAAMLGECYEKGEGVGQDFAEALRRYQSTAEMGSTVAMRGLSRLYAEGNGTAQDEETALRWLQKAAQKGNPEAMSALAYKHYRGEWGLFKDPDEGLAWLRKAGEAGNVDAMLTLVHIYLDWDHELYVGGDDKQGVEWLSKAVNSGSATAMRWLGDSFLWSELFRGDEHTRYYYIEEKDLRWAVQDTEMEFIIDFGCFDDDMDIFRSGSDDPDEYEAMKWYRKAAALGDSDAMTRLGLGYIFEYGASKDIKEGMKCLHKAVDCGNSNAMYSIGLLYLNGIGVEENREKTMEWLNSAAKAGSCNAMIMLGAMYFKGEQVPQNYVKALKYYRQAADAGDIQAMNNIGVMIMQGQGAPQDYKEAMKWLKKAADAGHGSAMGNLGWMYYNGQGVEFDPKKAREWYQKAIYAGCVEAEAQLKKIDKGACFITTAVCCSLQKPDDCYELTSFRAFRDGWLSEQPDGAALIDEYYAVAPPIVRAIDALPDAKEIYRSIWDNYLFPCLALLEAKNMRGCKEAYKKMVLDLKKKFG